MSGHFVNGVPIYFSNPQRHYHGINAKSPTWFSAQGGVYRCRELNGLRQNVAIKKYLVVEKENQEPETFVMPKELVENEIYTMTKCAPHPNILRLLGVHIYKDHIFLVMPLCDGGSLQQYCFDNRVSLSQMVFILKGLASGLAEIHRHGYIHRDIKCDNIFLGQDNTIVIGDFGVISMNPTADSSVEEAGVMLFWAPEVCEGKIINRKADIWALGIVVLEMLNGGKAPYEDDHMEEEDIKRKIIMQGRPHYSRNMDNLLVDFIDRCLERDPRIRASANELLDHPLLAAYTEEPLFPPRPRAEKPFPLPPALSISTAQTAIIPAVEIKDIHRTLVSPVIETAPKLLKERRDSDTSLSSSSTLPAGEECNSDRNAGDCSPSSAVHAFASSLSTIPEVSISSNASSVGPKARPLAPENIAHKRSFGKGLSANAPSSSKAPVNQNLDRFLHRVMKSSARRPEASVSLPLYTSRRRLKRAVLWTMASKSDDYHRLVAFKRIAAKKPDHVQQVQDVKKTDIALRDALRNAETRITSHCTDNLNLKYSLSSCSNSSAPFEVASIQIEEEILKCSIRSEDICLIDDPLLPLAPHMSITPERSSLMRTPKRGLESRLPESRPPESRLPRANPLNRLGRDIASEKRNALSKANGTSGPINSRLPVPVPPKFEPEPEPVKAAPLARKPSMKRGDADAPRKINTANVNKPPSGPKTPKYPNGTPPMAPTKSTVRSRPSKTEPARSYKTGKTHRRRDSAPDYSQDIPKEKKTREQRSYSLASVPNSRLGSSVGSQGSAPPRTPKKTSKEFLGRRSINGDDGRSRRSSVERGRWGYSSVNGTPRARSPINRKFDGRSSTNSVVDSVPPARRRTISNAADQSKWGVSSVGSGRGTVPPSKKWDGRASTHADKEKKPETRASKHSEKKFDGRSSVHADKKLEGRASVYADKKFDGRSSVHADKKFDGRSSVHADKKFDGRSSVHADKRFDGRSSVHADKKFDGRSSVHADKKFDGRSSVHADKKFDGRSSVHADKKFDGRSSVHADKKFDGRSSLHADKKVDPRSGTREKKWDGRSSTHSDAESRPSRRSRTQEWGFSSVGSSRKRTMSNAAGTKEASTAPTTPTRTRRSSVATGAKAPTPKPKSAAVGRPVSKRKSTEISIKSDGGAYSGDDEGYCVGGDGGTDGGDSGSISEGTRMLSKIVETPNHRAANETRSTSFSTSRRQSSSIAPTTSMTSGRRQVRMAKDAVSKDRRKSDVAFLTPAVNVPLKSALKPSQTPAKQRARSATTTAPSTGKTVIREGESVAAGRNRDGSATVYVPTTTISLTSRAYTATRIIPEPQLSPKYKKSSRDRVSLPPVGKAITVE